MFLVSKFYVPDSNIYVEQIFPMKIISFLPMIPKNIFWVDTQVHVQQRLIRTLKGKKKSWEFDIAEKVKN